MVGLGAQGKPCARAVILVAVLTLVSMMYLLGSDLQMQFIRPELFPIYVPVQDNYTDIEKDGYLIWSPSCQIPQMDPYHDSIKKYVKPPQSIVCSKFGPLTYISPVTEGEPYVLKVDTNIAHQYVGKQEYTCCYSNVTRPLPNPKDTKKTADAKFNIGSCETFEKEVNLTSQTEFIFVKCNILKNKKPEKEVYKNMHAIIPIKPQVREKMKQAQNEDRPNVMIVGIDSVSRSNAIRTLQKTLSSLKRRDWIELKGYNKIGDNTLPNLLGFLAGHSMQDIKSCWKDKSEYFDKCHYIWKEFSEQGYVTIYGEDQSSITTFNYNKKGFQYQPTDYYLRPFALAAENKLSTTKKDGMLVCLGPVSTVDHFLKYLTDAAYTFMNAPYFAFLWLNNISHNNPNNLAAMDYRFVQFFNELEQMGTLNNTFVIFLSDHGMRFGKIRETVVGWYEERLPFVQIWIPKWFRRKHPDYYNNLLHNTNKLTSPYDLYMTFKHILAENNASVSDENQISHGSVSCPECKSLFHEIPYNRSCEDAGITPHWCTCNQYETISPVDDSAQEAAMYTVLDINNKLNASVNKTENSEKCAELSLKRLVNVRGRSNEKNKHVDLVILIETLPGNAMFEATVRHHIEKKTYEVLGLISRINMYFNQSRCVNDTTLKLYCFCVSS